MPVNFRYDAKNGLDWSWQGDGAADLSIEEAAVVAQAETAKALQDIAAVLRQNSVPTDRPG